MSRNVVEPQPQCAGPAKASSSAELMLRLSLVHVLPGQAGGWSK
jgi:hypothetical protein